MARTIIETLFVLTTAFLIMRYRNAKLIAAMGTASAAYLAGICFSVLIFILKKTGCIETYDTTALEILGYVGIALGIPMLLFSSNVRHLFKLSKKMLLSFALLIISALAVSIGLFLVYTRSLPGGDVLSGMAVGLYTGGTPNLNAVAYSFRLDAQTILTANLSDMLFGGLFYVFLIFLAKPLTGKLLPKGTAEQVLPDMELSVEDKGTSFSLKSHGVIRNFLLSLLMVVLSAGVGFVIFLVRGQVDGTLIDCLLPALLIGTTVLGLLSSFIPKVNAVKENGMMGQYFTTVFSCSVASLLDFSSLSIVSLKIFAVYAIITTGVFLLHLVLCRTFNIDSNTMIVTSTAGIYGPAFVPGVAKSINAEYLLAGGLITGSFGYAVGTFLGIGAVWVCRLL